MTVLGICLLNLAYNIYLSVGKGETGYYLISLVYLAFHYWIAFVLLYQQSAPIHLHHWWLGQLVGFYFRYDATCNNILYMIAYGISIQGIVAYGADHIFQD